MAFTVVYGLGTSGYSSPDAFVRAVDNSLASLLFTESLGDRMGLIAQVSGIVVAARTLSPSPYPTLQPSSAAGELNAEPLSIGLLIGAAAGAMTLIRLVTVVLVFKRNRVKRKVKPSGTL